MIVPSFHSTDAALPHALDPIVRSLENDDYAPRGIVQAAWESVCDYLRRENLVYLNNVEGSALLLSKALACCNQPNAAIELALRAPSIAPLANRVDVRALSTAAMGLLVHGVIRPVSNSALCSGIVLILDGRPLAQDIAFEWDWVAIPVLRRVVNEAVAILGPHAGRSLLIFRGWSAPEAGRACGSQRRLLVEALLERIGEEPSRPDMLWID